MDNQNRESDTPQPITRTLLEQTVKTATGEQQVEIVDFTTKSGSNRGDSYASDIHAVGVKARVGCSDEVRSFHFIIKAIPREQARRQYMEEFNLFPKEIKAYTTLLPALEEVQRLYGVDTPVKIAAAEFYSSISNTEFLIFENLISKGYKRANKFAGLDYDHCCLAMKELGKFHALSYALKMNTKKSLEEEYPFLEDVMMAGKLDEMFKPFYEHSYNLAIKTVKLVDADLSKKMRFLMGKVYKTCQDIRNTHDGFDLILHGDFYVNNMLFKYEDRDGTSVPVSIKLLDFQIVRVGSPTLDLTYFFYTSTPYDLRHQHMQGLLKLYHDTFANTLQTMGLEYPEFTLQRLLDKFDKDLLFGYFFGCMALPPLMTRPDDTLDHLDDNEVGQERPNVKEGKVRRLKDNRHVQDRLKGIALDMETAGLI